MRNSLSVGFSMQGKDDPRSPASASLSVVRIGAADGLVIESSFKEGVKQETLRSLCQVRLRQENFQRY